MPVFCRWHNSNFQQFNPNFNRCQHSSYTCRRYLLGGNISLLWHFQIFLNLERVGSPIPASQQGWKPCWRFDQMLWSSWGRRFRPAELCMWLTSGRRFRPEEDQSIWSKRWQGFQPCCEAGIGETTLSDAWASWEARTSFLNFIERFAYQFSSSLVPGRCSSPVYTLLEHILVV